MGNEDDRQYPPGSRLTIALSQRLSRKALLSRMGRVLLATVGAGAAANLNLLPAFAQCDCPEWWYCGLIGHPCSDCQTGSDTTCPTTCWDPVNCNCAPRSWWSQCCQQPGTNCWYWYNYRDCCGSDCSPICGSRWCNCNLPQIWCAGQAQYGCTLAVGGGWCAGPGCPAAPAPATAADRGPGEAYA